MIFHTEHPNQCNGRPYIVFPIKDILDKKDIDIVEILTDMILPQLAQFLSLDDFIPFGSNNIKKATNY